MFTEFKGIRPLTEGLVDSDYVNCVPTGATLVDRTCYIDDGEFPALSTSHTYARTIPLGDKYNFARNSFNNVIADAVSLFEKDNVFFCTSMTNNDFLYRIYMLNGKGILNMPNHDTQILYLVVTDLKNDTHACAITPMYLPWITNTKYLQPKNWSWAVSSTKPNQIYFTFNTKEIFWFNQSEAETAAKHSPCDFTLNCMFSNILPTNCIWKLIESGHVVSTSAMDDVTCLLNWDMIEKDKILDADGNSNRKAYEIASDDNPDNYRIEWYDNKLMLVDSVTGVVNITCTDPAQFYRNLSSDSITSTWNSYSINNVWTNWYASNLSNDSLTDVIGAYGQVFFINNNSIECWTRSGNESAPLNAVSSFVSNLRIKKIKFEGNLLVAVAYENGKIGAYMVQPNQYQKISNSAVDKYLANVTDINVIWQNDESHIGFFYDGGEIVFNPSAGIWYRLTDNEYTQPINFIDETCSVSSKGSIIKTTKRMLDFADYHEASSTKLIKRQIIDNLNEFTKRKSFVQLDILGDMGSVQVDSLASNEHEKLNDDVSIVLEYSTTRGKTWSREFYRKAPPIGKYDAKVTYNGLGSGEAFLMKLKWFTQNNYTIIGIDLKVT